MDLISPFCHLIIQFREGRKLLKKKKEEDEERKEECVVFCLIIW